MRENEATLRENEATLQENEATLQENEATLQENEASLRENEATLRENEATLRENEASLQENEASLQENEASLQENEASLQENEASLQENEASLQENEASLQGYSGNHARTILWHYWLIWRWYRSPSVFFLKKKQKTPTIARNIIFFFAVSKPTPIFDSLKLYCFLKGFQPPLSPESPVLEGVYNFIHDIILLNIQRTTMEINRAFWKIAPLSMCLFFLIEKGIAQGSHTTDSLALVDLYNATNGANWKNKWVLTQEMTLWEGVTLSGGRVKSLILKGDENDYGVIDSTLCKASGNCRRGRGLIGQLPNAIGRLTELTYLRITGDTLLMGPIPDSIGRLTKLDTLNLNCNRLDGGLPTTIGNLSNLVTLEFHLNDGSRWNNAGQAWGKLPKEIGQLTKLKYLDVYNSHFEGAIPKEIGKLKSLQLLNLAYNGIYGGIPIEVTTLDSLKALGLHGTHTGRDTTGGRSTYSIPKEIGNMKSLEILYATGAGFLGSIPKEIGNLKNLVGLGLAQNDLTGLIPTEIKNLTNLTHIELSQNYLEGPIPSEIKNLTNLNNLQPTFLTHQIFTR